MKKITAAIIALIMTLGLCGCSIMPDKPEEVVEEFMEAMHEKNEDVLILYSENPKLNLLLHNTNGEMMDEVYQSLMNHMTWQIINVTEDKENGIATVEIEITNCDFSGVLGTYQIEAVKYTKDNLHNEAFTKETMAEECMRIFTQHVKAAAKIDTAQTQTIVVNLTKNETHGWNMELTDEMMNAILGGLQFPL